MFLASYSENKHFSIHQRTLKYRFVWGYLIRRQRPRYLIGDNNERVRVKHKAKNSATAALRVWRDRLAFDDWGEQGVKTLKEVLIARPANTDFGFDYLTRLLHLADDRKKHAQDGRVRQLFDLLN